MAEGDLPGPPQDTRALSAVYALAAMEAIIEAEQAQHDITPARTAVDDKPKMTMLFRWLSLSLSLSDSLSQLSPPAPPALRIRTPSMMLMLIKLLFQEQNRRSIGRRLLEPLDLRTDRLNL